jgi:hypothetical protein
MEQLLFSLSNLCVSICLNNNIEFTMKTKNRTRMNRNLRISIKKNIYKQMKEELDKMKEQKSNDDKLLKEIKKSYRQYVLYQKKRVNKLLHV